MGGDRVLGVQLFVQLGNGLAGVPSDLHVPHADLPSLTRDRDVLPTPLNYVRLPIHVSPEELLGNAALRGCITTGHYTCGRPEPKKIRTGASVRHRSFMYRTGTPTV